MESVACYKDLKRDANILFRQIPLLPQSVGEKRIEKLFTKCPVAGPLAVAHLLTQLHARDPNTFWSEQIEACKHAVRISHKLAKANSAWGMELGLPRGALSCFDVVHHRPPKQIPRYHSLPPSIRA